MLKSKLFSYYVGAAGGVCFFGLIALSGYFIGARPSKPLPERGLTYAFNQHGSIVYLTHFESVFLKVLFPLAVVLLGIGAYIFNNWKAANAEAR